MSASRRDFLRSSGMAIMAGASGFLAVPQFLAGNPANSLSSEGPAALPDDGRQRPTLVTIFLRGGADSLNAFIPVGDDTYYKVRPRLSIRRKGEGKGQDKNGALPIGDSKYWAVHPALEGLVPLLEEGKAAAILNVGSPHDTRSHFSAQDYMERAAPGDNTIMHGWLNRYLEKTKKPFDAPLRGLSAMTLLPRALRGSYPVLAGNNRTEQLDTFEQLYNPKNMVEMNAREEGEEESGSRFDDRPTDKRDRPDGLTSDMTRDIITESGTNAVERIKALEKASSVPTDASYPGGQLGDQLRTIAKVIKADVGLEVAQADYDGWDHHSGQGAANGRYADMLRYLTNCITAFRKDLGDRMGKVLVLVMSEFGRTVQENGANGTDHGRGGFMLAVGDMVKLPEKGKFYGKWKGVKEMDTGYQPVYTDFRTVFAESLNGLFGVDPLRLKIFPKYTGSKSDLLKFMNPLPKED